MSSIPTDYPKPPLPEQQQDIPGITKDMEPKPDYGEESYQGSGKLTGKRVIITGGDSGIGQAVAIAYAKEGASLLISYLCEDDDARETADWVKKAGRTCKLVRGDISDADHCQRMVQDVVEALSGIDILVNYAAHQMTFKALADMLDTEGEKTFATNIHPMFYLAERPLPTWGMARRS